MQPQRQGRNRLGIRVIMIGFNVGLSQVRIIWVGREFLPEELSWLPWLMWGNPYKSHKVQKFKYLNRWIDRTWHSHIMEYFVVKAVFKLNEEVLQLWQFSYLSLLIPGLAGVSYHPQLLFIFLKFWLWISTLNSWPIFQLYYSYFKGSEILICATK